MKNSLFFLALITNSLFAQMKQKEVYTVYLNYPEYTVKANILNSTKKIDVEETLTYYWYASNKILQTTGGYDGKILDGAYTSFYLSNNLKEKGQLKKGLKDGEWINWYENGKISEIINWKKGVKNGSSKQFDNKDQLTCESCYKHGQLHGVQTNYEDGKVVRTTVYKNGVEVIAKPKKEKLKKDGSAIDDQPTKTVKEKIKSIFKKKNKKEIGTKQPEKKQLKPSDKKQKKTLKEKFSSLFKKKEKSPASKKNIEPDKSSKPQATAK